MTDQPRQSISVDAVRTALNPAGGFFDLVVRALVYPDDLTGRRFTVWDVAGLDVDQELGLVIIDIHHPIVTELPEA